MKRKLATLLITGMAMAVLAACGTSDKAPTSSNTVEKTAAETKKGVDEKETKSEENGSEEKGKLGMLAMSLGYDFQVQMNNGIQRAADEKGYEYMAYDYNNDVENMMAGMDVLASSGVKAYYSLYMSPDAATSFMNEHSDIGVLTQGELVPGAKAQTKNDYTALANQFIESLDAYVKEHNITEGEIAALWINACENEDSEYFAAKEEMKHIIKDWGDKNGFAFTTEFFPVDDEEAANYMAQLLNGQPNVNVIFAFNNGFAIAAANEIAAAKSDVSEYFVFSSEGDEETFRLISGGESPLRACAYMDIEESGYKVGLQLINWIENGTMEDVVNEKVLITAENVSDYMK